MARISKKGIYSQCTRNKRDTFDYCGLHISRRPYQRIDEPIEIDDDENICFQFSLHRNLSFSSRLDTRGESQCAGNNNYSLVDR